MELLPQLCDFAVRDFPDVIVLKTQLLQAMPTMALAITGSGSRGNHHALPPVPRLLMRTVRNSAHKNLRLNLSAVRIFPRQFLADNRGAGLLT